MTDIESLSNEEIVQLLNSWEEKLKSLNSVGSKEIFISGLIDDHWYMSRGQERDLLIKFLKFHVKLIKHPWMDNRNMKYYGIIT